LKLKTDILSPPASLGLKAAGDTLSEWAFVALGSNLGDSADIVRRALAKLQALSGAPLLRSSLWQTTPVDCPPGSPRFINAIAALRPRRGETPATLLRRLQKLETAFGRTRKKILNEPRRLDLDLIAFGSHVVQSPGLELPHPRAHRRAFVLQPLAEIAPDLILPGQTRTVRELLRRLPPPQTPGVTHRLSRPAATGKLRHT
jgi:2-amino-4-hydroxy-6-hydroxymethyldihydropteridine diphosphokinase